MIRRRHRNAADIARHEIKQESKADTTRYTAPKVQKKEPSTAAATEAKKLKPQQQKKPAGNQVQHKAARVDPKTLYDKPRAQKQTAAAGTAGHPNRPVETQGVEMSQEKDVYEAMDPERESIYEETF